MAVGRTVTIGADPEVFLKKDGNYVSAIGLIGGTKEHPKKQGIGFVQEDNVAAEFNIPPAKSAAEFAKYIQRMLDEVKALAEKQGCSVDISSYARFTAKDLSHPKAMEIGCDPDFNAWEMEANPAFSAAQLRDARVAGGHVHIGYPDAHKDPLHAIRLIKVCDLYLGVPGVLLDPDVRRREFYGRAGAFRPKPYGVEYRVLSNFWIGDKSYQEWVFNQAYKAYITCEQFAREFVVNKKLCYDIQACINTGNKAVAQNLVLHYGIQLPPAKEV